MKQVYYKTAYRANLIHLLQLSVDSKTDFFKLFFVIDEKGLQKDVCDGGGKSCALFVSRILMWVGLARRNCTTVSALISEICSFGWYPIFDSHEIKIEPGAIILWGPRLGSDGQMHEHAGFYLGNDWCVSNDSRTKEEGSTFRPIEHSLFMGDILTESRIIKEMYNHPLLEQ